MRVAVRSVAAARRASQRAEPSAPRRRQQPPPDTLRRRRPAAAAAAAPVEALLCRPGHELGAAPRERALAGDIASIGAQFGYTPDPEVQANMLRVPDGARCSHGFPQAFVYSPFGAKPSSGGCRLSCPLLVGVIDDLEAKGGLTDFRKDRLHKSRTWRERLRATNVAHAAHRCSGVGHEEAKAAAESLGIGFVRRLLQNGVAGMSVFEPADVSQRFDVKCFHAQLGDWLCRVRGAPESAHLNPPASQRIGQAVAAATAAAVRGDGPPNNRGLLPEEQEPHADLTGLRGEGLRCWTACDPLHTPVEGDFKYEPKHNKIKLMHRKRRKQEQMQVTTEEAKLRMRANKDAQKREKKRKAAEV